MAVFTDPIDFVSLYGDNGLGFLVGDTETNSVNDRKNATNKGYVDLAGIKGYWRLTSSDYTSSSSPALADGTSTYNMPSDYDSPFRIYYRENGVFHDVEIVSDSEWLERSATRSTDKGDPDYVRVKFDGTNYEFELNRPMSSTFISRVGTLTVEYFKKLTLLSNDTDLPVLPPNLRHHILPVAGWWYALGQSDFGLADRLAVEAQRARSEVMKHDLTRTGRSRKLRPRKGYEVGSGRVLYDYGEE